MARRLIQLYDLKTTHHLKWMVLKHPGQEMPLYRQQKEGDKYAVVNL